MNIPRELIVEQIRSRGDADQTTEAEQELPEKVDPDRDADLLRRFDVDPAALVETFSGQSPKWGSGRLGPGRGRGRARRRV